MNMVKSCGMVISKNISSVEPITCNGVALRMVAHTRLLGPEIDNQLSWDDQLREMSCKISKKIGALKRAKRYLLPQAKHLLLSSVILPDFDYACTSFATGLSSAARHRLASLERRALRVACDADYTDDCESLYDEWKIPPLEERWCAKLAIAACQCTHDLRAPAVCNLLSPALGSTRHAATRGVIPPRYSTKLGIDSFINRASVSWNALPNDVRSATFVKFKRFVLSSSAMKPYLSLLFDPVSTV